MFFFSPLFDLHFIYQISYLLFIFVENSSYISSYGQNLMKKYGLGLSLLYDIIIVRNSENISKFDENY